MISFQGMDGYLEKIEPLEILSMFLMLVVALMTFASCGGNASKKAEPQNENLPVALQL